MSIVVVKRGNANAVGDEKPKIPADSIMIAKNKEEMIYISDSVPKGERVKEHKSSSPLSAVPYIDVKSNQRSGIFISGISGSGKSTLAVKLIKKIRSIRGPQDYEEEEIVAQPCPWLKSGVRYISTVKKVKKVKRAVIFTNSGIDNDDPAFKDLSNHTVVRFSDPEFLDITVADLEGLICCFDDHEAIQSKTLSKHVENLVKDVLERSRKLHVDCVVINHMSQNYHKTRGIIFECDTYFLNPRANSNSTQKFLAAYTNLNKKQIQDIINYEPEKKFTWLAIRKSAPQYMIYDDMVRLI